MINSLINEVIITNILGEIVFKQCPSRSFITIDVSSFSSNLYSLRIMYGNHQKVEKLFIQH